MVGAGAIAGNNKFRPNQLEDGLPCLIFFSWVGHFCRYFDVWLLEISVN